MPCTAVDLTRTMNEFLGGSDNRYRHTFNKKFIYTEGVRQVAEAAGAFWFIDILALEVAQIYAAAWLKDQVGIGIVTLKVFSATEHAATPHLPSAIVSLSLADDAPDSFTKTIPLSDFPVGEWTFYLGTDEDKNGYVTTVCLPQEY